jgi:hypothetical protein
MYYKNLKPSSQAILITQKNLCFDLQNKKVQQDLIIAEGVTLDCKLSVNNLKETTINIFLLQSSGINLSLSQYFSNQRLKLIINIVHLKPESCSFLKFINFLDGKSELDLSVQVIIQPEAVLARTNIQLHSFLLAKTTKAKHEPKLRIYNKEVQARHGSIISGLPANTIEYLYTRGLNNIQIKGLFKQDGDTLDQLSFLKLN